MRLQRAAVSGSDAIMSGMQKLADRARELSGDKGPALAQILNRMNEEERSELQQILADRDVSSAAIAKALQEFGWKISESSVRRYRSDRYYQ